MRIIPSLEGDLFAYSFESYKTYDTSSSSSSSFSTSTSKSTLFESNDFGDDDDDDDNENIDGGDDIAKSERKRKFIINNNNENVFNEKYEKIPFDMDDLLKTTFLYNPDLTLTGSINSNLIRIDFSNGNVI